MIMRDTRINLIFEGTNEILRLYIALSGLKDTGEYLKEIKNSVGKIFDDPIKGFGVLSRYATKKVPGMGRDKLSAVHPALREQAAVYEEYTLRLHKASEELLRKYGKNIVGMQFPTKRVADIAIDLFVGLCVLSRVTTMLNERKADECVQELAMAHIFTQQAKRRMNQNIRRLIQNEDDEMRALSEFIVEKGSYPWDTI